MCEGEEVADWLEQWDSSSCANIYSTYMLRLSQDPCACLSLHSLLQQKMSCVQSMLSLADWQELCALARKYRVDF